MRIGVHHRRHHKLWQQWMHTAASEKTASAVDGDTGMRATAAAATALATGTTVTYLVT